MGVQAVYGGSIAWVSDIDKGANKILAHRFPGVPNLGDITTVDWSQVEPVDILTGGSPCQDLSHAGRRAGLTEGTRSNLWVAMREAIAQLRPATVVWENVRGAFSAAADSEVEPCAGCVGDGSGVHLRALGRVLGDLSDLGYDCRWHGLRAADVGAPHGRFRVFVVAVDAAVAGLQRQAGRRLQSSLLGSGYRGPDGVTLLPTPAVNDMGEGKTPDAWDEWTAKMKAAHGNGNGHGASLAIEAQRLLPTPNAADAWVPMEASENTMRRGDPNGTLRSTSGSLPKDLGLIEFGALAWGDYAPAIARWEAALERPAPAPTMTSTKGNPQLSSAFVEWMMGLPAGWIADVPSITRNEALKALGNGVVPQQAAEALRVMATWGEVAA
jgi:DNA (cytosine-5)-methyltransferase 1